MYILCSGVEKTFLKKSKLPSSEKQSIMMMGRLINFKADAMAKDE
jgi:hypothetical protein